MKTEKYYNYIEFLQKAKEFEKEAKDIHFYDNILFSFKVKSGQRYKYIYNNEVIQPNKFVSMLGFNGYNAFIKKRFSKLKDFSTEKEVNYWYGGYFGGLIGVNHNIVNDYIGTGEISTFYDYDINSAYLHTLTGFLPTKFVKKMKLNEFSSLNEMDKIPYFYFFKIELQEFTGKYLKIFGRLKQSYSMFDFLNVKQEKNIIVSEKRFSLINQIYMRGVCEIKEVYVFEKEKFAFYKNIVNEYLSKKNDLGKVFKKNALRLYGSLGQIYRYEATKMFFDKKDILQVYKKKLINFECSPQIAMWVADSVAETLFNLISQNLKSVICFNTDGMTSICPLKLRISKRAGEWKFKKIKGVAFLLNSTGKRLFFKDVENNEIVGGNNIYENDGKFYENFTFTFSKYRKGLVKEDILTEIERLNKFDINNTFRSQVYKDILIHKILREEEKF